ncbi:MAG: RtcB family protein, partial [Limisphaerales bacterium]
HCGSRGFGHQVATDYLRVFEKGMSKYGITVIDRELGCAPFSSPEGKDYYAAMLCAANAAFVNRQMIIHRIREGFEKIFGKSAEEMGMRTVYDVAHNIAKIEEYELNGHPKKLLVHRKGATRSFGPGDPDVCPAYREVGQPVIVGGSMETGSYLLVGTKRAQEMTFGSTLHGSGRTMSRTQAKKKVQGRQLQEDMRRRGILVKTVSYSGLAEEAGFAYKDIAAVVEAVHQIGISRKVVRLKPIGNIKG